MKKDEVKKQSAQRTVRSAQKRQEDCKRNSKTKPDSKGDIFYRVLKKNLSPLSAFFLRTAYCALRTIMYYALYPTSFE
jgi:hypothetical protein